MSTEQPEPRRQNTTLVVLGLAALLLLGTAVGFLVAEFGDSPSTTTPLGAGTTTSTVGTSTTDVEVTTTTGAAATSTTLPAIPAGQPITVLASEDTVVSSREPDASFGAADVLEVEQDAADDMRWALLRFDLTNIPSDQPVVDATLRLTVLDASSQAGLVNGVAGPWTETETTWASAPPIGAPIAPLTAGEEGARIEIDVSPAVTEAGIVDFYLTVSSPDGFEFTSRHANSGGPELVVTLGEPGTVGPPRGMKLVGAGDIASCASEGDEATAALLDRVVAGAVEAVVFTVGDNAYEGGSAQSFTECYEPTWGRHKGITRPAVGSREYRTAGASGYFDYFGGAAGEPALGYYSYDFAGWHIAVLNSNCSRVGGCELNSVQGQWLQEDLRTNDAECSLAYWQRPLFSSGAQGGNPEVLPLYQILYDANAEIIVNGNDHFYERFALQDPNGGSDPEEGIRQFIIGTGGRSLDEIGTAVPNSESQFDQGFGVLSLTLAGGAYEWRFLPVTGSGFTDVGGGTCQ